MSDASARGLRTAVAVTGALALVSGAALVTLIETTQPTGAPEPEPRAVVVEASAGPDVPLYEQVDPRWSDLPFAGGTVSTHGCGLTCAAMAWEALSGEACTPADLLGEVGDSCTVGGLNHMPSYCEWMLSRDTSLSYSGPYEGLDRTLADLRAGRLVFGALTGELRDGGRSYGGHLVLLVSLDGGLVTVHDPCEAHPVGLTRPELEDVAWDYFVSIGRN